MAPTGQLKPQRCISEDVFQGQGQCVAITRLNEQTSAGGVNQFWEGAVSRQNNRNSVGPRFKDVESFRFPIRRWHAKNIQRFQEIDLFRLNQGCRCTQKTRLGERRADKYRGNRFHALAPDSRQLSSERWVSAVASG